MTGLNRTDLPTSDKVYLCATSLATRGQYGANTELSQIYDVSRPTVYAAGHIGQEILERYFETSESLASTVHVDARQLERTIVGLRVVAPNSIRSIEDLIPVIYPGVKVSFGKIQSILVEAEHKAAAYNAQADLSGIQAGALDEMFSQGNPVLAGVDLDGGYLFSLALREQRRSADWQAVLNQAKQQGLNLQTVVKDAALGIAAAVTEVFPAAEQRDDCFHAVYAMGNVRRVIEQRCYGLISQEESLKEKLSNVSRTGRGNRTKIGSAMGVTAKKLAKAMARHDAFEQASRAVVDAMEFIDLETGLFRTAEQMEAAICGAAEKMIAIDHCECQRVGKYIRNRACGLSLYMKELGEKINELAAVFGQDPVRLAGIIFRLNQDLSNRRRPWDRVRDEQQLQGALKILFGLVGETAFEIIEAINQTMCHRHRASSAIEGFNAALRPFLYVQKGVTSGFLELFRAHYNLRTRRWGRHQGTSAHESLTGEQVSDWLSFIGYPPSNLAY